MNTKKQQRLLAQALVLTARAALVAKQSERVEIMHQAIGELWSDCPDLIELQAGVLYLTHRTGEALALLHDRTDTRSLALKALCLSRLQDPGWREPLHTVLTRDDDAAALTFAQQMLALEKTTAIESLPEAHSIDPVTHFQGVRA